MHSSTGCTRCVRPWDSRCSLDIRQLYSTIIMEQSRSTNHKHELPDATVTEKGHNPSCGDEIELSLRLSGDVIEEASFTGHGCAISQASTSLLCELIEGNTVAEAQKKVDTFLGMIKGEITDDALLEETLGDALALKSISYMPQRVKCAVLAWHTLDDILKSEPKA